MRWRLPARCRRAAPAQTYKQALAEAFGHRSYILLVLGFFTCGFQLGFVTVHLPAYLIDRGLSARGRRLDARRDRALQHRRCDAVRLARRLPAEALHPVVHLFCPRAGGHLPHHAAGEPGRDADLRRRDRAALAFIGAADLGPRRGDVRHALARHAVRRRLLQPSGRRLPRHLSRRRAVSSRPVPTRSYGGSGWCSACCPPS